MSAWIKVEDKKPELPCLVYDAQKNNPYIPASITTLETKKHGEFYIDDRFVDIAKLLRGDYEEFYKTANWENRITHWMPLPEPPGEGPEEPTDYTNE